jgi:serine protease Do
MALVCLVLGGLVGSFVTGPILHGQNAGEVAIPKEITSYRDVVKKVLPAVVSIEGRAKAKAKAEKPTVRRRALPDDEQIPEEFRKFFEELQKRQSDMPDEAPHFGFGSGFIVDPKGVVLTNYHVVAGADEAVVQLMDGRKFVSRDIKLDRKTDLAIVRIQAKEPLPYLELGNSDTMEIGDRVLAVGAPFGLTGSVTAGIISAKGRNGLNVNMYEDFLQTDAAINPGNSGGPLVNMAGQVIGINSAIKSRTGGFQGVGLAIASNLAKSIIRDLGNGGVVHRGYLGVQIGDLSPEVAARLNLKTAGGVEVRQVFDGSPAAKAGLQPGDIVTGINGKPVKDGRDLQHVVAGLPLHRPVDLDLFRDGKNQVLKVTIEEQPDEFGTTASVPRSRESKEEGEAVGLAKVGLEVRDLSAELAQQLGYKDNAKGALIAKVQLDSIAADAGLVRGMLITKVDNHVVSSAEEVKKLVEKGSLEKGILLQVQSPRGGVSYVVLKAEAK